MTEKPSQPWIINLERLVLLFLFGGILFKYFHVVGAGIQLGLSALLFIIVSVIKIVRTKQHTNKPRAQWANILSVMSGLLLSLGIFFKLQYYAFAPYIVVLGIVCLVAAILLTKWRLYLKKRHVVMAALFILRVQLELIEDVKYEQFKSEIRLQKHHLAAIIQKRLAKIPNDNELAHLKESGAYLNALMENKRLASPYNMQHQLLNDSANPMLRSFRLVFQERDFNDFAAQYDYPTDNDGIAKEAIPTVFRMEEIDPGNLFYGWHLQELSFNLLQYLQPEIPADAFEQAVMAYNTLLKQNVSSTNQRQQELQYAVVLSCILLICCMYVDRLKAPIQLQKPVVFFAVFLFLEFILLTIEPYLQLHLESGFFVNGLEIGLAALIIPFHSMVEHNLYNEIEGG